MDLSYAAAALEAWAPESFTSSIEEMTRDVYYTGPCDTSEGKQMLHHVYPQTGAQTLPVGARTPISDARKQRLYDRNNSKARFGSMMDGVMALWMTPTAGHQDQETTLEETTTARELEDSRNKVQAWMDEGLNSRAEP
jgi:hypothetical protein